ncbi:hypothetical protein KR009_002900 [Drosophila setifemur]|nr:hypothetical protein KR009_002900 [Drosophila setifemur]
MEQAQKQEQCHQELQQEKQDQQKKQESQELAKEANSTEPANNVPTGASGQQEQGAPAQDQREAGADQETQKKRCDKCGKKLGLTGGFPCRCGGTYCAYHRYSDRHECNFDYREMGATEIRRDNPVIIASKLRKI